jgi:hypothetical protein
MRPIKEIIISQNKWSSYRAKQYEGSEEFFYSFHDERTDIGLVSILPYQYIHTSMKTRLKQYLLCRELVVAWESDCSLFGSITGAIDRGMTPEQAAVKELWEEGGYKVEEEELYPLGTVYSDKHCDTKYYLFTIDLTDKERRGAKGDGTFLEKYLHCEWVNDVDYSDDSLVYTLFYKLELGGRV